MTTENWIFVDYNGKNLARGKAEYFMAHFLQKPELQFKKSFKVSMKKVDVKDE